MKKSKDWVIVETENGLSVCRKDTGVGVGVVFEAGCLVLSPVGGVMEPWSFGGRPAFRVGRTCEATICSSRWKPAGTKRRRTKKK